MADMATDLEAARLMVLRGAWAIDNDHPEKTKWCAMAKRMATDACFQIADEALQLLLAPNTPSGVSDLLLMPDQMMLQIHESIGHPLELDRILGDERWTRAA